MCRDKILRPTIGLDNASVIRITNKRKVCANETKCISYIICIYLLFISRSRIVFRHLNSSLNFALSSNTCAMTRGINLTPSKSERYIHAVWHYVTLLRVFHIVVSFIFSIHSDKHTFHLRHSFFPHWHVRVMALPLPSDRSHTSLQKIGAVGYFGRSKRLGRRKILSIRSTVLRL